MGEAPGNHETFTFGSIHLEKSGQIEGHFHRRHGF